MGKTKKCFIITPIGNENSDTFRKAKGVIESVIKPVLKENGFGDIKPAYEIMESGMISNQIISRIVDDDLVIANLTGNNPNVMYELAIRHCVAKPIIHICENETDLPFDIKDNRTIFYEDDIAGGEKLKSNLEEYVRDIDYLKEYNDNPIFNALKSKFSIQFRNNELYQESDIKKIINSHIGTVVEEYQEFKEKCEMDIINLLKEFNGKFEWIYYNYNNEGYKLYLQAKFNVKIKSFYIENTSFNIEGDIIRISNGEIDSIRLGLQKICEESKW